MPSSSLSRLCCMFSVLIWLMLSCWYVCFVSLYFIMCFTLCYYTLLPPPKEVMFLVRSVSLSVCLTVCPSDNWKSCERILMKFLGGVGVAQGPMSSILVTIRITLQIQESEVRNPHSLDYRKSYQRILMKFYRELGCGLETNWLHFGDDPHHCPDPYHDPDPGRTATILLCWLSAEVCALWVLLVCVC